MRLVVSSLLAMLCGLPPGAGAACSASVEQSAGTCLDNEADWRARSGATGVFYANNFDYPNRAAYLAGAHSYRYEDSPDGKAKLDLETTVNLTGRGASRHNWFASEGPNEQGPVWAYSFDGPGRHSTTTSRQRVYVQFAMYADPTWARFTYAQGAIKTHILLNPASAPFAHGEIVLVRSGRGPWPHGFSVSNSARGWMLTWQLPRFVQGDDTIYTFWDGAPGTSPPTDVDAFERRYGPRRRHFEASDPDYAKVPHIEGGRWYVIELYVELADSKSVVKMWFAERGKPAVLLSGTLRAGINVTADTYRGGFLINRAENARQWVDADTFVVYDELLLSDQPIDFPGGFPLPSPGIAAPPDWPPPATGLR
jgi:hypothetical protein